MPITKRTRFEVLRRDSHRCRYCGAGLDDGARLTVDHVTPVALGGTDTPDNLVAACIDCNAGKTSTSPDGPLVAQVAEDAVRWSRAMARAAQEAAADRQARDDILEAVDDAWRDWKVGYKARVPYRPEDWQRSIERLIAAGLTAADLTELVDVAMRSKADDPWRYFCGCCWKRVTQMQERAREILDAEEPHEPHDCMCIDIRAAHGLSRRYPENEHTSESECEAFTEGEAAGEHDAWKVCFELHASLVLADDALVGIVDYGFDAYRLRSIDPWCPPELAPPAYAINHRHGQGVRIPKVA